MGGVGANNLTRTGMQCPPGPALPQNRLNVSSLNSAAAVAVAPGIKPDTLWQHPNRYVLILALFKVKFHIDLNKY